MISNIPTPESLNNIALRTYFRAWDELVSIFTGFSLMLGEKNQINKLEKNWPDEWQDYLISSQNDLQSVCSLMQQSMELALKARVCTVSPYLLLLDTGMKLTASAKQIDFSELRTLDAVDLPGAVNTLTDNPVSDAFIEKYTGLRSLRNKITHLGEASVSLTPEKVLRHIISLYVDIWSDRDWLPDRLAFAAQTRRAWLYDGKYTSTHMEVLQEWPIDIKLLTKSEFKRLFRHNKAERRYLCHHCVYEGDTRYAGLEKPDCGTAYLDAEKNTINCIMCKNNFVVEQKKCPHCNGNVVGANGDDWVDYCHSCGENILE